MEFLPAGPEPGAAVGSLETDVILAIFPIATGGVPLGLEGAWATGGAGGFTTGAAATGLGLVAGAGVGVGLADLLAAGLAAGAAGLLTTGFFAAGLATTTALGTDLGLAAVLTGLPALALPGDVTKVLAALTTLAKPESLLGFAALAVEALAGLAGTAFVTLTGLTDLAVLATGFFIGFLLTGLAFLAATDADLEVFFDAISPLRQLE